MSHDPAAPPFVVTIVGGGLSGAAVAYHLARQSDPATTRIIVAEPRAVLGQGLAYSTPDPDHRLNVPDHKMSLDTTDPEDFKRWLRGADGPALPTGSAAERDEIFAPRIVFADYVAARLKPYLDSGHILHITDSAVAADVQEDGRLVVTLAGGQRIVTDRLVLSITHPAPRLPTELAGVARHSALIPDAYAPAALDRITPRDRVLVLGSGLTAADVVATLTRRGHLARINLLSRHGRLSQQHGPLQGQTSGDFAATPARTALALLRHVRQVLDKDATEGLTWHAAFDKLRAQGQSIWAALPLVERRRFLRHLRGLWDIHRFRIAPQTHAILAQSVSTRRVLPIAGRIVSVQAEDAAVRLRIKLRNSTEWLTVEVDKIVLATGPAHADAIAQSAFLTSLAGLGLIAGDALGLGLATSPQGYARTSSGKDEARILIGGPLARGTVGELMGVPEVTGWAMKIADEIARQRASHAAQIAAE